MAPRSASPGVVASVPSALGLLGSWLLVLLLVYLQLASVQSWLRPEQFHLQLLQHPSGAEEQAKLLP